MSEDDLLGAVLSLCKLYGWRTLHLRAARTEKGYRTALQGDGVGWPDIFAVKDDRIVCAELKSDKGVLTDAQREWLFALSLATHSHTYCWTPKDWDDGTILSILSGKALPAFEVIPA